MRVEIISFRPVHYKRKENGSGHLLGYLRARIPKIGLSIRSIRLYKSGDQLSIQLPGRPKQLPDGRTEWIWNLKFDNKETWEAFEKSIITGFKEYQKTLSV